VGSRLRYFEQFRVLTYEAIRRWQGILTCAALTAALVASAQTSFLIGREVAIPVHLQDGQEYEFHSAVDQSG